MRTSTIAAQTQRTDAEAEELFLANQALVTWFVRRYNVAGGKEYADLKQACALGLWQACLTYNLTRKTTLATHARTMMRHEVQDCLRRSGLVRGRGHGEIVPQPYPIDKMVEIRQGKFVQPNPCNTRLYANDEA